MRQTADTSRGRVESSAIRSRDLADRPRPDHDLDRIAWKSVPVDHPTRLGGLMRDTIGHLDHHLAQLWVLLDGRSSTRTEGSPPWPGDGR